MIFFWCVINDWYTQESSTILYVFEGEVTPGLTKEDYSARRNALMKMLHDALLINKEVTTGTNPLNS